jgi:hypothetical protein|tara:strand:- start:436 stop:792 length:357 start_codon:yes stop_codon:yes gene_type:complete
MVYIKPSIDDSDINAVYRDGQRKQTAISGTHYPSASAVMTEAGYGVRYRVVGDSDNADNAKFDVEILDAYPARKLLSIGDPDDTLGGGAIDSEHGIQYDSDTESLTTTTNEFTRFSLT